MKRPIVLADLITGIAILSACSNGGSSPQPEQVAKAEAPNVPVRPAANPLKNAYFGELHIHTAYSVDGYLFGNHANDPEAAYRFARGEAIDLPVGGKKQIRTPLDFTAVTDHAEALAEFNICNDAADPQYNAEFCTQMRNDDIRIFSKVAIFAHPPKL